MNDLICMINDSNACRPAGQQHVETMMLAVWEKRHNKKEFLVKWLGYGPEHNTWEPETNLTNCTEVLQTFWDAQRGAPEPAKDQQGG